MKPTTLRSITKITGFKVTYFVVLIAIARTGFYPPTFRAIANVLFDSMGPGRIAKFEPSQNPKGIFGITMRITSDLTDTPIYPSSLGVDSVRQGYVPTAVLVALVLAMPLARRRKWRALLIGVSLVQVFVATRIAPRLKSRSVQLTQQTSKTNQSKRRVDPAGRLASACLAR